MLASVVGVEVVGGADELRRRGDVARFAPLELGAIPEIVLDPHATQDDGGGNVAQPRRSSRVIDGRKQPPAIVPDGQRQGGACRLSGREPVILGPPRIAVLPLRETYCAPPVRGDDGKIIAGVPHRFANHLEAVQGPHGSQNMGGVGALAAPGLDQVAVTAPCEQRVEEHILRRAGNKSGAKCTED
jgi:hypothetical protein